MKTDKLKRDYIVAIFIDAATHIYRINCFCRPNFEQFKTKLVASATQSSSQFLNANEATMYQYDSLF